MEPGKGKMCSGGRTQVNKLQGREGGTVGKGMLGKGIRGREGHRAWQQGRKA